MQHVREGRFFLRRQECQHPQHSGLGHSMIVGVGQRGEDFHAHETDCATRCRETRTREARVGHPEYAIAQRTQHPPCPGQHEKASVSAWKRSLARYGQAGGQAPPKKGFCSENEKLQRKLL